MIEVVAALIWEGEKFMICQRPAHKARGLLWEFVGGMIVPTTVKFNVDHYICGDSFRSVWAIKEYPPQTSNQAILSRFGDKEAFTLHMYTRFVDGVEQRKILQNASRKNKMLASSNDIADSVTGEGNLEDVVELLNDLYTRN